MPRIMLFPPLAEHSELISWLTPHPRRGLFFFFFFFFGRACTPCPAFPSVDFFGHLPSGQLFLAPKDLVPFDPASAPVDALAIVR